MSVRLVVTMDETWQLDSGTQAVNCSPIHLFLACISEEILLQVQSVFYFSTFSLFEDEIPDYTEEEAEKQDLFVEREEAQKKPR